MKLDRLAARPELKALLFHMSRLQEIQASIDDHVTRLDSVIDNDPEACRAVMGELEAELFFQIPYHLGELRKPFEELLTRLYGESTSIVVDEG